jgi:hypothetical protein
MALALDAGARDVLVLARHPQAALLLSGAEASELRTRFERNTAALLQGIVRTHPEYLQLRLIDAQAHGLERIRVDRDGDTVRRIEGDELLEKGHQPYVYETLRRPAGAIYLSDVSLQPRRRAGRPGRSPICRWPPRSTTRSSARAAWWWSTSTSRSCSASSPPTCHRGCACTC